MAMHADVPAIDLDLTAGNAGVLPLPAERVAAAFRAQSLTWTVREAVRVLADVDCEPVREHPSRWDDDAWIDRRAAARAPRRTLPPLPPRKPAMAQLSLFD